jgi:hypothetical protein
MSRGSEHGKPEVVLRQQQYMQQQYMRQQVGGKQQHYVRDADKQLEKEGSSSLDLMQVMRHPITS